MSLLATIKKALGFDTLDAPSDGGPFRLGPEATRVVTTLPAGRALFVETVPVAGGHAMRAWVDDEVDGPGRRVILSQEDHDRLTGIVLDHDGERFVPRPVLTVAARATPNPQGRKYETDRWLAYGPPREFRRGEPAEAPLAERLLAIPRVLAVMFHDNAVTVRRDAGAPWDPIDRAVEGALREHLLLCGPPVSAPVAEVDDGGDLEAAVRRVLSGPVLEKVHRDGGDIQLVDIVDGMVRVRLFGACASCPASRLTLQAGVRRSLQEALPGRIRGVEAVDPYEPTEP